MTDERRGGDPLAAAARLPRGGAVILRHDAAPGRASLAAALARLCRRRGLRLLIARDEALALRHHAGLHLAEGMRPSARFRLARRRRRRPLLTAAAHGRAALAGAAATATGADLALLSPLFPTASHPGAPALGPCRFARLARASRIPVAALGGLTAARVRAAAAAGAAAVAAVGALHARGPRPLLLHSGHGVSRNAQSAFPGRGHASARLAIVPPRPVVPDLWCAVHTAAWEVRGRRR